MCSPAELFVGKNHHFSIYIISTKNSKKQKKNEKPRKTKLQNYDFSMNTFSRKIKTLLACFYVIHLAPTYIVD